MTRKQLRESLAPFSKKSYCIPLAHLTLDAVFWLASLALALLAEPLAAKLLGSILMAISTSRLFIIGHDACHQSLTPSRPLNGLIGRLCFLTSLIPYSLWEVGHNVAHHGYHNLRGYDYVWVPLSPEQYAVLPAWRRALEKYYRSGIGFALYYLIELWWKRLYFPSRQFVAVRRTIFVLDDLLVSAFALAEAGLIAWIAPHVAVNILAALAFCVVLPFLFWCGCIGFVTYCQHTHPSIGWYANKADWTNEKAFIAATVHNQFTLPMGGLLHWIFEHPVHHANMLIPFYRLRAAQVAFHNSAGEMSRVVHFTWGDYWRNARACGLYDFESGRWLKFPG